MAADRKYENSTGNALKVEIQNQSTVPATTMQTAAVANGNGTSLNVQGYVVALLNVVSSPAMSGGTTLNFEASVDDVTWVSIAAHLIGTNGNLANTATADGDYRLATAGYKSVRARISGYSAGSVTVKGYVSEVASQPTVVALATSTNSVGTVDTELPAAAALADAASATPTTPTAGAVPLLMNTTTLDRQRAVVNSMDSVGTGIAAAGMVGQLDDTSPSSVTENQFATIRITPTRFAKVSLGDLLSGEDQTNNLLQVVEKPLAVSTYTPDLDTSAAAEKSSVTKASAGNLYGVTATNNNAAVRFLQFFNSTTVPADATVPVIELIVPANGHVMAEWPKGRNFATGIAWCFSTTSQTKTIITAANDALADVLYK